MTSCPPITAHLSELGLVGVVGLHGRVQLVQHLQDLLVDLKRDLATLKLRSKLKNQNIFSARIIFSTTTITHLRDLSVKSKCLD